MQTNAAVEQNKNMNGPRVRGISPVQDKKRSMEEMICRIAIVGIHTMIHGNLVVIARSDALSWRLGLLQRQLFLHIL